MSLDTEPVPRIPDSERITVDDLGYDDDGIIHVVAHFGYMERTNVPDALRLLDPSDTEGPIDLDRASYFLSKLELMPGRRTDDGAVAQAAVHRDVLHHRRRGRLLRPAAGADGDHRVPPGGVTRPRRSGSRPGGCCGGGSSGSRGRSATVVAFAVVISRGSSAWRMVSVPCGPSRSV